MEHLETGPCSLLEQQHSGQHENPSASQNTDDRISVGVNFEHQIPEMRLQRISSLELRQQSRYQHLCIKSRSTCLSTLLCQRPGYI